MNIIKGILRFPWVYQFYQWLVGAHKYNKLFVDHYICYKTGQKILDIGCGPADILKHLPQNTNYTAIDLNKDYINKARKTYPGKTFIYGDIENINFHLEDEIFDTVFLIGVLHHLTDETVEKTFLFARKKLKKGGRMLSLEPVITPNQRKLERWFMNNDRGKYIRNPQAYKHLTQRVFSKIKNTILTDTMSIPFTIIITEAIKE